MSLGHPRLLSRLRQAPVTVALMALQLAVLAWVTWRLGDPTDVDVLVRAGALERGRVWSGEPWRLLTAAFLHVGWIHLGLNVAFGFGWCQEVERALGAARFLALWLLAALAGSALSLLVQDRVGAGASGALFGMIGAVLALHRRTLPGWRPFLTSPATVQVAVSLGIYVAVTVVGRLPVDHAAHAGGLLAGALGAWAATGRRPRAGWAAVTAAVLAACLAAAWPRPGLTSYGAQELEERLRAALRAEDHAAATALLARAAQAGYRSETLTFHQAILAVQEGRLAEAARLLEPLTRGEPSPVRLRARAAAANLRYQLAGTPAEVEAAVQAIQAACAEGDPRSCQDAEVLRRHGGGR